MPTTVTIGQSNPHRAGVSTEFNIWKLLLAGALIVGGYEVSKKYDLVQNIEALLYGFPADTAQANADVPQLQRLLTYANSVGDLNLQKLVQARLNAIAAQYGTAGANATTTATATAAAAAPTASTTTTQVSTATRTRTGTTTTPVTSTGGSLMSTGTSAVPAAVQQASLATTISVPTNIAQAHLALIQLDTLWFLNLNNKALQSSASIEANYIRQRYPSAGPAGGYTWKQLVALQPNLSL